MDPADLPRMEDGPVVAQETVRRITCDSAIVRLIESGAGEPLDYFLQAVVPSAQTAGAPIMDTPWDSL